MKTSRLLLYGIAGILSGLLIENSVLRLRRKAAQKVRKLKSDTAKDIAAFIH